MKRINKFLWLLCTFTAYAAQSETEIQKAARKGLIDEESLGRLEGLLGPDFDLSDKQFLPKTSSKEFIKAKEQLEKITKDVSRDSIKVEGYGGLIKELNSYDFEDSILPLATLRDLAEKQVKNVGASFDQADFGSVTPEEAIEIENFTKVELARLNQEQLNILEKATDPLTGKRIPFVAVPAERLEKQMFILQGEKEAAARLIQRVVEPQTINNCGWHSLKNIHERLSNHFKVKPKVFTPDATEFNDAQGLRKLWDGSMGELSNGTKVSLFMLSADFLPADIEDQTRLLGRQNEYINEIRDTLKKDKVCAVVMYTGSVGQNEVNAHWLALTISLSPDGHLSGVVMDSLGFVDQGSVDLEVLKIKSKNFKDLHMKPVYYNFDRLDYKPVRQLLNTIYLVLNAPVTEGPVVQDRQSVEPLQVPNSRLEDEKRDRLEEEDSKRVASEIALQREERRQKQLIEKAKKDKESFVEALSKMEKLTSKMFALENVQTWNRPKTKPEISTVEVKEFTQKLYDVCTEIINGDYTEDKEQLLDMQGDLKIAVTYNANHEDIRMQSLHAYIPNFIKYLKTFVEQENKDIIDVVLKLAQDLSEQFKEVWLKL